jgi:DNA-binding MarR family transcriptional regulator
MKYHRSLVARQFVLRGESREGRTEEYVRSQWLRWQDATRPVLASYGLVYDDVLMLSVMEEIARRTLYPSQKQLSLELEVGKVAIARSLTRLENKGYVCRRWSICDRRTRRTHVTRAGKAVLQHCEERFAELRFVVFGTTGKDRSVP